MPSFKILLTSTNVARSTKTLVTRVQGLYEQDGAILNPVMEAVGGITEKVQQICSEMSILGTPEHFTVLEKLIDDNQRLLQIMCVSHTTIDKICHMTSKYGIHTKLTGAGGGGCTMSLLKPVATVQLVHTRAGTYQDETRLFVNLTTGYMACVRPNLPTPIDVFYSIRTLGSLDIATQTMTTSGWLTLAWSDSRLMWTPSDFGSIDALEVDFIWRPKFAIGNQVDGVTWHGAGSTVFRIFKDGTVRWNVPIVVETSCDVDIINFPFDTQTCALTMNFWTVSDHEISSIMSQSEVNTDYFSDNGEWILLRTSSVIKRYEICCPTEDMQTYSFSLTFQRRRQYYVINLLLPTLLMSFVIVWAFLLPVDSGERLGFALTVLLAYTVMLTLTTDFLPTTSIQIPHIAIYILVGLIMCTGSVALTVINVKIYNKTSTKPSLRLRKMCAFLERVVFCGTCFGKQKTSTKVNTISVKPADQEKGAFNLDNAIMDISLNEQDEPELDWPRISEIFDRLYFYVYLMILVGLNVMFLAILA